MWYGADGVHLGESDAAVKEARQVFDGIIGASRHSKEGARRAELAGADYIGCGPLFETSTRAAGRNTVGI